jgi:hypothetical protein
MTRIVLIYKQHPEADRWMPGDRYWRPIIRRLVRGKPLPSGVDKVFINLCLGLDRLGISYAVNLPFRQVRSDDQVGILGRGRHCIEGYDISNPIVAGVAVLQHPSEWPTLCQDYPVVKYLQHSEWTKNIMVPYFGKRCEVWPVGIDTETWKPEAAQYKSTNLLIYDKILSDYERNHADLMLPILDELKKRKMTFEVIRYGQYLPSDFQKALGRCRAMIFLSENESQGIAYQECLSSGVPILAWDRGWWLDRNRHKSGDIKVPATSVPYFDERCGMIFENLWRFRERLDEFVDKLKAGMFKPRDFILDNLTLEKCAKKYVAILEEANC